MFYDAQKNDHGLDFNPFKAIVSPRPIGWISSQDAQGRANLAPYSFFNGISSEPPMIGFASSGQKLGIAEEKDSLTNILETQEFCVNIVSYDLRNAMNVSSSHFARGVDEFDKAGLTKGKSQLISAPYVAESPVSMECKLFDTVELPGGSTWVMGSVIGVHVKDAHIKSGRLDVESYQPLARLGYRDYSVVTEVFELIRPDGD